MSGFEQLAAPALRTVERQLIALGFLTGEADSLPDNKFVSAVQAFERVRLLLDPPTEEQALLEGNIRPDTLSAIQDDFDRLIPTDRILQSIDPSESAAARAYRQAVVEVAFGELGNREGPNNDVSQYRYMPERYDGMGLPWCSGMTDWVRSEAAERFGLADGDNLLPTGRYWNGGLRDNISAEKQRANAETFRSNSGVDIYHTSNDVRRGRYQPNIGDSIVMEWTQEGSRNWGNLWLGREVGHSVTIVGFEYNDAGEVVGYRTVGGNMSEVQGSGIDELVVPRTYDVDDPRIEGFIDNGALFDARAEELNLRAPAADVLREQSFQRG